MLRGNSGIDNETENLIGMKKSFFDHKFCFFDHKFCFFIKKMKRLGFEDWEERKLRPGSSNFVRKRQ